MVILCCFVRAHCTGDSVRLILNNGNKVVFVLLTGVSVNEFRKTSKCSD